MKNVLIGLLIAAAGTGVFFLLRNKKKSTAENKINKEWIVGKWKADAGKDSVFSQYQYDFTKDGNILKTLSDSAKADTSRYEWNKDNDLVWKEKAADSTGKIFSVIKITRDSLQVQSKDSTTILFTKIK